MFRFKLRIVDMGLPKAAYAQTALADLDGDGRLEYIVGQHEGTIYWYKTSLDGPWTRHVLGERSPSDVGGCVLDVVGDGRLDFVAGGAWYRNHGAFAQPFERIVFDPDLAGVHDLFAADIDGDGQAEIVTMSDRNTLRWYDIPADPRQLWTCHDIGSPVHAGASAGDLNGNGHLDIVRTDGWFENVRGDGTEWVEHPIGPNTYPPDDFQPSFAFDATHSHVCDLNRNGVYDIVFTDAEIPGGKVWWMENIDGTGMRWLRHEIAGPEDPSRGGAPRRGAYHSLYVGDLCGDGDLDILSCEMEAVGGELPPRWYIWENVDGVGGEWREHVILDANLGGHAAMVGDLTGNGLPDVVAKPWRAVGSNALGGRMFIAMLENVSGT
jgi:hypothetical protein